jgi:hypothetical protein
VGLERPQRQDERISRVDAFGGNTLPSPTELVRHELGVGGGILKEEYSQRFVNVLCYPLLAFAVLSLQLDTAIVQCP